MKSSLFAAVIGACALSAAGGASVNAADLDDEVITHETIIERRPVVHRDRVIVRRYVEPAYDAYDYDDDVYGSDAPVIGVVVPYWGHRGWGHHRGWRGWGHRRW